jgi:cell division protease FtsH
MLLPDYSFNKTTYSEETAREIDREVEKIIKGMVEKVEQILEKHKKALEMIAKKLMEVETLERDEYEKLLLLNGIEPKPFSEETGGELFNLSEQPVIQ